MDHFVDEGMKKNTIYVILKRYQRRRTTKRKVGSGKEPVIMTKRRKTTLKKRFNNRDDVSQYNEAKKYNCTQQYISKCLKSLKVKRYKKKKAPYYRNEDIKKIVQKQCRWMCRQYRGYDLVIDDEKYFLFRNYNQIGNDSFYSDNQNLTPSEVKYKSLKKNENKLMLYIAISNRGISKPYFCKSGLNIRKEIYINKCLKKITLPFIREYHNNRPYVLWPDKASSHYANLTKKYFKDDNINFVSYDHNPTNLPQCRPIEDFFGYLSSIVYAKNWKAKSIQSLKNRIRNFIKKVDISVVQRMCNGILRDLRKVADNGPLYMAH